LPQVDPFVAENFGSKGSLVVDTPQIQYVQMLVVRILQAVFHDHLLANCLMFVHLTVEVEVEEVVADFLQETLEHPFLEVHLDHQVDQYDVLPVLFPSRHLGSLDLDIHRGNLPSLVGRRSVHCDHLDGFAHLDLRVDCASLP
jgi:hypothetical protein